MSVHVIFPPAAVTISFFSECSHRSVDLLQKPKYVRGPPRRGFIKGPHPGSRRPIFHTTFSHSKPWAFSNGGCIPSNLQNKFHHSFRNVNDSGRDKQVHDFLELNGSTASWCDSNHVPLHISSTPFIKLPIAACHHPSRLSFLSVNRKALMNELTPWIRDYFLNLATLHGSSYNTAPPVEKTRRCQLKRVCGAPLAQPNR